MRNFKESQNMVANWMLLIVLVIIGYNFYRVSPDYKAILEITDLWIFLGLVVILWLIRLKTRYNKDGIQIVFIPFIWKKFISWEDIGYAYVRSYSMMDFGGWGYRFGKKQGKAYTTKGNQGLQLVLKDGSMLMIGTQEPEEIQKILNQYKPYKDEF